VKADLKFKSTLRQFSERWLKSRAGPCSNHLMERRTLRSLPCVFRLLKDFPSSILQLLYLTKLLVDSLNDAEIQKTGYGMLDTGARNVRWGV